jgi:mevalonate pyrophosphate decarboxylase
LGKYANQIPANPSISYTLNHCNTQTSMEFLANEPFSVQTFLAGNEEVKFAEKIEKYFKNIEQYLPWILKGNTSSKPKIHFRTVQELQVLLLVLERLQVV